VSERNLHDRYGLNPGIWNLRQARCRFVCPVLGNLRRRPRMHFYLWRDKAGSSSDRSLRKRSAPNHSATPLGYNANRECCQCDG
jgi:hypothetical protein